MAGRRRVGAVQQQQAGGRAEAVYTSSPPLLQPPPVKTRPGCAPAGRGYKTANCRKALAKAVFYHAYVKAQIL